MKLYIKIFKGNNFGNYYTDILIIPHNHLIVSEFKKIIEEKYGIKPSDQRITVKMCNMQFITMTNEFPLNFYFIREKSIIFIEFLGKSTKINELTLKSNKGDIRSLGSIGDKDNCSMETIEESTCENMLKEKNNTSGRIYFRNRYNSLNNYNNRHYIRKTKSSNNLLITSQRDFHKSIKQRLSISIIQNRLLEFKEIMDKKYNFIDINSYLDNYKYAAIHYSAIYGYLEMMKCLVNKYGADVNLISADKWSALHLSSYKGHYDIVNILLQCKDIKYNLCLPKIGTPLHCACARNNVKIVSLLLHKCDPLIRSNEGLLPIDITNDLSIKNIINKIINKDNYSKVKNELDLKVNNDINIINNSKKANSRIKPNFQKERKMDFINFTFLKYLMKIPTQPPIFKGFIYIKEKNSNYQYNLNLVEINPIKGFLLYFLKEEDFPNKPIEAYLIKNIKNLKKKEKDIYFYIELILEEGNHIYRFQNIETRNKWFDAMYKCITFKKYWNNEEKRYPEASAYLNSLLQEIMEINYENGEIRKYENKKITKIKQRRYLYLNLREDEYKIREDNILNRAFIGFNCFELLECLGSGSFGKVFKVRMKTNGEIYAMKVINKTILFQNHQLRYAVTECNVLKQVNSPFILTLYYSFQTEKNLYMILDYCPGGDLNFHILQNVFEENEAKFYIAELILGIEHLHKLNIIYRDLKPENILINSDNHIKLADFGLAKEGVNDSTMTKSFCGSPAYLSPEMIIRKGAGKSADMYGIGAVLYEMIRGTPPFYSNDIKTLYYNITRSKLILPDYFSEELKDLLKQLLCKDPHKRIGVLDKNEIKNHIWFKGLNWNKIASKEIKPPIDLIQSKKNIEKDYIDDKIKKNQINFKDRDYPDSEGKKRDLKRVPKFTFIRTDFNNQ